MVDFKKMVEESEGPLNLENVRHKRLFDTEEEPSLSSITEKLVHAANVIVDHRIAIALGLETNANSIFYNGTESEWILRQVEPMLKEVQQTRKIQASNAKDITELLSKGKVSFSEAKQLMEIINQKTTLSLLEELE